MVPALAETHCQGAIKKIYSIMCREAPRVLDRAIEWHVKRPLV